MTEFLSVLQNIVGWYFNHS